MLMSGKSSIGDHRLMWSHIFRSVVELDETAYQLEYCCFGKGEISNRKPSVRTWKATVVTKLCADEPC